MKRLRRGRTISVHVTNQVGQWRQLESFNERATFANPIREFQRGDGRKIGGDAADDADGVVPASIEHDDELKLALVLVLKITRIITKHRFDPVLFVVSWNQEQEARLSHGAKRLAKNR